MLDLEKSKVAAYERISWFSRTAFVRTEHIPKLRWRPPQKVGGCQIIADHEYILRLGPTDPPILLKYSLISLNPSAFRYGRFNSFLGTHRYPNQWI